MALQLLSIRGPLCSLPLGGLGRAYANKHKEFLEGPFNLEWTLQSIIKNSSRQALIPNPFTQVQNPSFTNNFSNRAWFLLNCSRFVNADPHFVRKPPAK